MYCYTMDLFCMNLSVLAHTSMYLYNRGGRWRAGRVQGDACGRLGGRGRAGRAQGVAGGRAGRARVGAGAGWWGRGGIGVGRDVGVGAAAGVHANRVGPRAERVERTE